MKLRLTRSQAAKLGLNVPSPSEAFMAACREHGIDEPVPEYRFAPNRKFAFDWAWPHRLVALEQEGAIFGTGKPCPCCKRRKGGGHSSITGILRDMEKYNLAAEYGWRVLRMQPAEIESGKVFEVLKRILKS